MANGVLVSIATKMAVKPVRFHSTANNNPIRPAKMPSGKPKLGPMPLTIAGSIAKTNKPLIKVRVITAIMRGTSGIW